MKINKEKLKILTRQVDSYNKGSLIIKSGFKTIDVTNGIDWNYKHSNNENTYQTYLHSLNFIKIFTELAVHKEDKRLMKEIRDIILDWRKKNSLNAENFAWTEHSAASRVINIIYFQEHTLFYRLKKKEFDKIIIDHCQFLNDEKNYKMNNHGLMMDNALINAAAQLTDPEKKKIYTEKALYRIRYAIQRDFSRNGVHLENSPEYHRMILMIYRNIEKKLKELKIPLGKQESEILKLAHNYRGYIIQPNNVYPMIGDTGNITDSRIQKVFRDFHDTEAGITIFNNLNEEEHENSSMMIFKSGYYNKTHKHYDDLSTYLYLDGEELLIDSGKYNYVNSDPVRQHIVSPKGHNVINLPGQDYKLINPFQEQFNLKITKRVSKASYKLVTGINKLYKGTTLTRYNILTKENVCIILDRVISKDNKKTYQNFNINENAKIKKVNDTEYEIMLNDKLYNIQTYNRAGSNIKSGIEKGYISRKFGDYQQNERILFKQEGKNLTYITVIHNMKNDIEIDYINLKLSKLTYSINGKEVSIEL